MNAIEFPVIAGGQAGKTIRCNPDILPDYQNLVAAAQRGNHWARIAIKELTALTTGVIGKDNIYVKPMKERSAGVPQYQVLLPGLVATVRHLSSDQFTVVGLSLDTRYLEAKKTERPGLYRAQWVDSRWAVKYKSSGKIEHIKDRAVAISDARYGDPQKAAQAAANRISSAPGVLKGARFKEDGFDFHFTPGKKTLGGLRQYGALGNEKAHGSALMLAHTMKESKHVERANWVSEFGGSTILTQAMKILVDQGVTLEGHSAYVYRPKTSPNQAVRLAHKLQLTIDHEFSSTGFFDPVGSLSNAKSVFARLNSDTDEYNWGSVLQDAGKGTVKIGSALGVVTGLGLGAAATFGASFPAIAAISSALGIGASLGVGAKVASGVSLGAGTIAWGASAVEPHRHRLKKS